MHRKKWLSSRAHHDMIRLDLSPLTKTQCRPYTHLPLENPYVLRTDNVIAWDRSHRGSRAQIKALDHITSRGNGGADIYLDARDRQLFLDVLASVGQRLPLVCYAYCLMSNHYHLVMGTPQGNLPKGMRQLNGVYTQSFNRRHGRSGHVFQGRYKAILADRDAYLLEVSRYVVLNPVRATMVSEPAEWPWSSYRATVGTVQAPRWLDVEGLLSHFGQSGTQGRSRCPTREERPKVQWYSPSPSPPEIEAAHGDRHAAMAAAYGSGGDTMKTIAAYFGVR